MKVKIPLEECWRADEIRRIGLALKYHSLRDYHRQKLLEELDRTLPDYERPLKKIDRVRKGIRISTLISYLLP